MEILIPADRIQARVNELLRKSVTAFRAVRSPSWGTHRQPHVLADLVRRLELPLRIGLIQASSYRGESTTPGRLYVQPELLPDVRDRHILLLDDILDTGKTLDYLISTSSRT